MGGELVEYIFPQELSSGSDGGGDDMEGRVKALEKTVGDMRVDIVEIKTSIDSHFPNLATKTDVAEMKTDINTTMAEIKGLISTMDARISSELPNFATKTDVAEVRGIASSIDVRINSELPNLATKEGLVKTENKLLILMITSLFTAAGLAVALTFNIMKYIK